jgi:NAD+ kinase
MVEFRNIYLYVNFKKELVRQLGKEIALRIVSFGRKLFVFKDTIEFLSLHDMEEIEVTDGYDNIDLAVVLGGDGTLLSAVSKFANYGIPMVGINLGTLGFLSEFSPTRVAQCFAAIFNSGDYKINVLDMLYGKLIRNGKVFKGFHALNDFVIQREATANINIFDVYCNDSFVDTISGDGVVISTPTGSTAYSLSGGGPLLEPGMECILFTPLNSHSLNARPIVFSSGRRLNIIIKSSHNRGVLSVDGQSHFELFNEDNIEVTYSNLKTRLITLTDNNFFDVLREKLNFGLGNRIK